MADLIGQQFGNYRLTRLLGSGGFAEVYLGEHVRLNMQAAIKILHTQLTGGDADAFQEEARTIAELIHPHIIRVLDFDLENGTPFLVLDYAPAGSLRQRHPRGERVPLDLVVSYVNQMADALQYAHDHKHVHRDVKPENMLIGRQQEILLTDFGIASIAHSTSSMDTEAPLGTLAYMAPEQIQGHARPASDQYALAITAYLWLTGLHPFRGSSAEVIGQQLGGKPAPLRTLVPELSPLVEQVVLRALEKDPRARFEHIRDFALALSQASQGQAVTASTFSYTAQTVVDSGQTLVAAGGSLPDVATAAFPTPATPPSMPASWQMPEAAAAAPTERATAQQVYAPTSSSGLANTSSYLQPTRPYVPPAPPVQETTPLHAGMILWHGLLLGIYSLALLLAVSFGLLHLAVAIMLLLWLIPGFFWEMWIARRTGSLAASFFSSLLAVVLYATGDAVVWLHARDLAQPVGLLIWILLLALAVGMLGGWIGQRAYQRNQPIHPPAGGTRI